MAARSARTVRIGFTQSPISRGAPCQERPVNPATMPESSPALTLSLRPSRALLLSVLLMLLLAALALWASRLPDVSLLLLPLLGWTGLRACSRHLPLNLWLRRDGSAVQLNADGSVRPISLLALHERGPIGVLVIERDGRLLRLPWASDSLARAARRELRLWMRDHVVRPATAGATPANATTTRAR